MLFLISLQILPGGNGGGVCFAQGITVILIGIGGRFYLKAQVFLTDFIPVPDRIAVFDLDGTLMCETYPFCFEYNLSAAFHCYIAWWSRS